MRVRWLIDECVDARIVVELRKAGHDALYVSEAAPRLSDGEIIHRASGENRILLTEDKDFGELVYRWGRPVPGLVLLRIDPAQRFLKWPRLSSAIDRFGDTLFGHYVVVEPARLRVRSLRAGEPG